MIGVASKSSRCVGGLTCDSSNNRIVIEPLLESGGCVYPPLGFGQARCFAQPELGQHGQRVVAARHGWRPPVGIGVIEPDGRTNRGRAPFGRMIFEPDEFDREFGPLGIRANVVSPSMTETGMIDGMTAERFEEIVSGIPLKRAGRARDVAGACLFLASDLSAYVTGATLDVNGGSHIH